MKQYPLNSTILSCGGASINPDMRFFYTMFHRLHANRFRGVSGWRSGMKTGLPIKQRSFYRMILPSLRGNDGYILPFTLSLLFAFSLLTLHATREYIAEKQFYKTAEEFNKLEMIEFFAVRDLKALLMENSSSGRLNYDSGYALYRVEKDEDGKRIVELTCYTHGGAELQSRLVYDVETGTFVE